MTSGTTGARAATARAAGPGAGRRWDEPAGAVSPRGWLHENETVTGFYLDYGPEHYRSPHEYCQPGRLCRECQPGNVLAVRYPGGPGSGGPRDSRFCETVAEARGWVETGAVPGD
jgi:hypothetical protein